MTSIPLFFFASQVSGDRVYVPKFFIGLPNPRTDVKADVNISLAAWGQKVYLWEICTPMHGILISLAYLSKNKRTEVEEKGIRRVLKIPDHLLVMGDCGAWQYKHQDEIPYTPEEITEFYERAGYDYGITLDQLVLKGKLTWKEGGKTLSRVFTREDQLKRMEYTLQNAKIMKETSNPKKVILFGSLQGVTSSDYERMTEKYLEMGYDHLAVGGVAKTNTRDLKHILNKIIETIYRYGLNTEKVKLHILGVGRPTMFNFYKENRIYSFDTARFHRVAWIKGEYLFWDGWELQKYDVRPYDYRKYRLNPPIPECQCPVCMKVGKDKNGIPWAKRFGTNQRNMSRGFHNLYHFWRYYNARMRGTLVITGCTKIKAKQRSKAKNLYKGRLFRLVRRLCEQKHWDYLIISAKYGLVKPEEKIEPYEEELRTSEDIKRIQSKVLSQLKKIVPKYGNIIIIAGEKYRSVIKPLKTDSWFFLKSSKGYGDLCRMVSQKIGEQTKLSQWLKD